MIGQACDAAAQPDAHHDDVVVRAVGHEHLEVKFFEQRRKKESQLELML